MEKSTKTISVRVPQEIGNALDDESKSAGVSVNTLINQVLTKYTRWERFEKELGIIHLSKESTKKLFSIMSENDLKSLASSSCKAMLKDMVLFIKGRLTVDNLIKVISIWLNANNTSFRRITTLESERYIIKHELGKNYSLYLGTTISLLFSEIDKKILELHINEQDLIFEIEV